MGYYGAPVYPTTPYFDPCCSPPFPAYGPAYPPVRHGSGFGFALIVVVVILLIILGAVYYYQTPRA
ncbi:MAG: sporulation protein YjcZ [Anaerobacillus sp.]|jgi:hypothetical protein|uniref:sporulation protein YjcZ n=1 Tax=Anaerobacillus sp. TaxID=1872506 RepID=UPI00391CB920